MYPKGKPAVTSLIYPETLTRQSAIAQNISRTTSLTTANKLRGETGIYRSNGRMQL